ncbi:MAG TPA: hypothetical protein VF635_17085 [Propionibacteriaceae bacterium]
MASPRPPETVYDVGLMPRCAECGESVELLEDLVVLESAFWHRGCFA